VESLEGYLERTGAEPASPGPGPEAQLRRQRLQERVWQALSRLSEKHREILVLRDYQDLSYAEIASVLGIPKGTVMSRLHAARCSLRRRLREMEGARDSSPHPVTRGDR
jgi:RNA polymerase sigma-70 factor (ECF subfamily)